ncbi:hypothetical protein ABZ079_30985 [Streptomyces sp. NPDC006314]|uniref:hypothetical protein n=1 Tax=Streptomyces sp. NPDC006314 TaxID=3154475 RepID=UPI0033BABFF6
MAEHVHLHVDTVASIEQGRLALQPYRAEQFDEVLETGGALTVPRGRQLPRTRLHLAQPQRQRRR